MEELLSLENRILIMTLSLPSAVTLGPLVFSCIKW